MFKDLKAIGISLLCLICGLMLIVMAFTDPEFSIGSLIFASVCGLIFIAFAILYFRSKLPEISAERARYRHFRDKDSVFSLYETVPDTTETDRTLSGFRKDYADFFSTPGVRANSGLQNGSTQLFWHTASLRKKRLDEKKLCMNFVSERKKYSEVENVSEKEYFDGKYRISEYSESIAARTDFLDNGETVFTKTSNQIAHYVISDVEHKDLTKVICPNCGAETTQENLIDGCDYCGTAFTVSDLHSKVSAFRLKNDYKIQYEKYRLARSQYNEIVFTVLFIFNLIVGLIIYAAIGSDQLREIGGNLVVGILAAVMSAAMAAAMLAFLGLCFFWVAVFPFIQANEFLKYASGKALNELRQRDSEDALTEKKIRESDPFFSVHAFYSGVRNKLAVIHYADSAAAFNAFFEADRTAMSGKYRDVIDMDISDIRINGYGVKDGLQQIDLTAGLTLAEYADGKAGSRRENIRMTLIRSDECRTHEICEPAVFTCRSCGASIALESGKTCQYCGSELDLKKYDWIIRDYVISQK